MNNSDSRRNVFNRVVVLLLTFLLIFSSLPVSAFASLDKKVEKTNSDSNTITLSVVYRGSGGKGPESILQEPVKITAYKGISFADLVDDATQQKATYKSNGELQKIMGKYDYYCWRAFVMNKDGKVTGEKNVRDLDVKDGDKVIITNINTKTSPLELPEVTVTWDQLNHNKVTNVNDLTANTDKALETVTLDSILNGNDKDAVTENLILPESVKYNEEDFSAEWKSSNPDVITDSGKVKRPGNGNDIDVTLTLTLRGGASKTFSVKVKAYSSDEQAVLDALEKINWNFIRGKNESKSTANVYYDLILPTEIEGCEGVNISWKSSNTDVIDNTGKVTRPEKDTRGIILTVTASKGDATDTKEIKINCVYKKTNYEINLEADTEWLKNTWIKDNISEKGLTEDIKFPASGQKKTTITWESSDESVISKKGEIYRDRADGKVKTATVTANLKAGNWNQYFYDTVTFEVKVLPWDNESQNTIDAKTKVLEDIINELNLPGTVNSKNQKDVTAVVRANREKIDRAYQDVLKTGLKETVAEEIPAYKAYANVEKQLKELPKNVTVSILDVTKNGDKDYSVDGTYYLPKTKIKIGGLTGNTVNSVNKIHTGLKNSKIVDNKNWIQITKDGNAIKTDSPFEWHVFVNGEDKGTYSSTGSKTTMALEHGDTVIFKYVNKNEADTMTVTKEQAEALSEKVPVEYDYNDPVAADVLWLEPGLKEILNGNRNSYEIKTDLSFPETGKNGSSITWETSDETVITKDGKVTVPGADSSDKIIVITAEFKYGSKKDSKEIKFMVPAKEITPDEKHVAIAKEQLQIKGLEIVTGDIELPAKGFDGADITWESSNQNVISNKGKVTRSENDEDVKLTATIKSGNVSDTKVFNAHVIKKLATDKEKVTYEKENLTFESIKGTNSSENKIENNLELPVKGLVTEIKWKSSNEKALLSDGTVKRTDKEQKADLTATIISGNEKENVVFSLTILPLDEKAITYKDALDKIKAVPDAVYVTRENRKDTEEKLKAAKTAVDEAVKNGYEKADFKDIEKLKAVEIKLEKLPVAITYSVVGADIKDKVIQKYRWFVEPCKLLVPSDVNMSDVTMAMIRDYPYVMKGKGASYYGNMYGLSEFDAGAGSGWVFAGTKVDVNQAASATIATEGAAICWGYIGDVKDGSVSKEPLFKKGCLPLSEDAPITKNLVPKVEKGNLNKLIEKAETLKESDFRDYGAWKNTWENMQKALAYAEKTIKADSALTYEVEYAENQLSDALNRLEPAQTDKTELVNLIEKLKGLDSKDYYKDGWDKMQAVLGAAERIAGDKYADRSSINSITADLKLAEENLIPSDQADKTKLNKVIQNVKQLKKEYYTLNSWNKLSDAVAAAERVYDDAKAAQQDVDNAVQNLEESKNLLVQLPGINAVSTSKAVHNLVSDYRGTIEPWKIMDMVAAGHGNEVNEKGYFTDVVQLLEGNRTIPTDIEKTTIVLTALGYDATDITMPDGTKRNLIKDISEYVTSEIDVNALIWGLTAFESGDYDVEEAVLNSYIEELLKAQNDDGGWPVFRKAESDLDMTAMAISSLSPYREKSEVEEAVKKGFELLEKSMEKLISDPSLNYGNCNTTAMAIIGAASVADNNTAKTILQRAEIGGLSYYVSDNGRFGYKNRLTDNDLASEQAMRAFTAHCKYIETNQSVNIYHFGKPAKKLVLEEAKIPVIKTTLRNHSSDTAYLEFTASGVTDDGFSADIKVTANGRTINLSEGKYKVNLSYGANTIVIEATSRSGVVKAEEFIVYLDNKMDADQIEVSFTLLGDDKHGDNGKIHTNAHKNLKTWIKETKVTVAADSKVADVMAKISAETGYKFNGLSNNWVNSVTTPEGLELASFDNGKNSGWMYTLNGGYPSLGVGEQIVADGDKIVFHYTDDYTAESNSDEWNRAEAQKVEKLINAIGTVTLDKEKQIYEASDAYDALPEVAKKLVKNSDTLKAALKALEILKGPEGKPIDKTDEYRSIYNRVSEVYAKHPAAYGSEWIVLGLSRGGYKIDKNYFDRYYQSVAQTLKEKNGVLHKYEYAKYSKTIVALTAAGYDPQNIAGYNLVNMIKDLDNVKYQGFNGPVWALIALDTNNYKTAPDATATREALINEILSKEIPGGGWTYSGTKADVDMTAMTLQALAPYYKSDSRVKTATDRAVNWLSEEQTRNAGFREFGGQECSESTAQVIVALTALGIDPLNDGRFIKGGRTMVDALCDYYLGDGSFEHLKNSGTNGIATEQGLYALAAYLRFRDGKTSLYDMTDTVQKDKPEDTGKILPVIGYKGNATVTSNKVSANVDPAEIRNLSNALVVKLSGNAEIRYDKKAVEAIKKQIPADAENVEFILEKVEKGYNSKQQKTIEDSKALGVFSIKIVVTKADGETFEIHNFEGGKATITVPFANPDNLKLEVYRVEDDGKIILMNSSYKNGMLSWITDGHSIYMVTAEGNAKAPETGDTSDMIPWVILLMGASLTVPVLRRKSNK